MLRRSAFTPNIKERADCSTALFTPTGELLAQSESIPVHLGSMPASVAAAIAAVGDPGDRRADRAQRSVRRRHPPQRRDRGRARAPRRNARRLGGEPGAPCRHRRRGAGIDSGRRHPHRRGGDPPPAGAADARSPRRVPRRVRAPRRAGRRPRRPGRREPARCRTLRRGSRRRRCPFDEVLGYGERRMRAALADAARRHVAVRRRGRLDRRGTRRSASRRRSPSPSRSTATRSPSTSPAPTPQSLGNVNAVEAVTVSAVGFALRSATDPTIPANGGAHATGARGRPERHGGGGRRSRRPSAPATSR